MAGNEFQVGAAARFVRAGAVAGLWLVLGGFVIVFLQLSPAVDLWLGGFKTLVFSVTVGMVFLAAALCAGWVSWSGSNPASPAAPETEVGHGV